MPNPFMRLGSPNRAQGSPVDKERPTGATDPVPEQVAGTVFPYRGMEKHGVEPTQDWRNTEAYEGDYSRGVEVDYEPVPDEPDPIPVYIVETESKGRQVERGVTFRSYAPPSASGNVISADYQGRRRISFRVKNLDSTTVYVGYSADQASLMHGWPLAQNEVFEGVAEDDLWAYGTGAAASPLAVTTEYAVNFGGTD
jgi:hypothetical protein